MSTCKGWASQAVLLLVHVVWAVIAHFLPMSHVAPSCGGEERLLASFLWPWLVPSLHCLILLRVGGGRLQLLLDAA